MAAKKKSKSSRKGASRQKPAPGVSFEKAVARVQQMLDPNSVVTHNQWLVDRVGNKRQFDVVVRGQAAGHPLLVVIECRDHNRKKGPSDIEAFATKAENVGANVRIVVSRRGFTKQAVKLARFHNITALSLLPSDVAAMNPTMFTVWYSRVHEWLDMQLLADFVAPGPRVQWSKDDLLYEDAPVTNYFMRQLDSYSQISDGVLSIDVRFSKPLPVMVKGTAFLLNGLRLDAGRKTRKQRGKLLISGDGFFDWSLNKAVVPKAGRVAIHNFNPECADWETYDAEFPPLEHHQAIIDRFTNALPDIAPVPNLQHLISSVSVTFQPAVAATPV